MATDVTSIWTGFHKELKAFILNKTRNAADTDDILQEVFIKIIRNIDKLSQAENLSNYLYGIVRNAVNDYFRSRQHTHREQDMPEQISEHEEVSLNTTIAECCIRPFIGKLPEKYKEALLVAEFSDVSQKDLAEQLNISYSGAKSRVQRGREKLKDLILDCCALQADIYGNLLGAGDKDCSCN